MTYIYLFMFYLFSYVSLSIKGSSTICYPYLGLTKAWCTNSAVCVALHAYIYSKNDTRIEYFTQ